MLSETDVVIAAYDPAHYGDGNPATAATSLEWWRDDMRHLVAKLGRFADKPGKLGLLRHAEPCHGPYAEVYHGELTDTRQ